MELISEHILTKAGKKNVPLRKVLTDWATIVKDPKTLWTSIDDVRQIYPTADGVELESENVVTIFNIKGKSYRLISYIDYAAATVQPLEVLTHGEYDKEQWKDKY